MRGRTSPSKPSTNSRKCFEGSSLPPLAVEALRALFRLDCDVATAVEEALILHAGAGGVDLEQQVAA